ncbi:MAG TPA: chemotaxis protein CheD [Candidatus Acidoferrales bacterium]|nr:chemotaxis protein CheD [Candidatus Acidoferrales bacterium]
MLPTGKWVIAPPRKTFVVGVADMVVSNDSSAEIVTYSLGSCLGITIYDAVKKIGGLLHLMLPDSRIDAAKAMNAPFMFVDTGVPRLFHAAYHLGAERSRLTVKVAGGAQLLDQEGIFNIGARNFDALQKLLAQNGIKTQATDTGGLSSRTLRLDLTNGNVSVKTPGEPLYLL